MRSFWDRKRARDGKLPGGRGFVLTEYEPVASHGDPIHDIFLRFWTRKLAHLCLSETYLSERDVSVSERDLFLSVSERDISLSERDILV